MSYEHYIKSKTVQEYICTRLPYSILVMFAAKNCHKRLFQYSEQLQH